MSLSENARRDLDPELGIPRLVRETLHDRVYLELRNAIMSGAIMPGTTVTIRALAKALGTSQMPAREALRRLVAEHALEMLPNRTVKLPVVTSERFKEIYLLRVTLEGLATEVAATSINSAELDRMERIDREMMQQAGRTPADYLARNREFHFTIYNAAQLPIMMAIIEQLWLQIGPLLNHIAIESVIKNAHNHHRTAIDALRVGDGKAARAAIETDISDAERVIVELI
jgi:DNA-binding GntR family transcriptional regulator